MNVGGFWMEAMLTEKDGKRLKEVEKRQANEELDGLVVIMESKALVPDKCMWAPRQEHCMRVDPRSCKKEGKLPRLCVAWLVRVPVKQEEVDSPSTGVWIHDDGSECFRTGNG